MIRRHPDDLGWIGQKLLLWLCVDIDNEEGNEGHQDILHH
jgi:hypothetical protein